MLRYLTSGESHGKALLAILEGLPSGLKIARERIDLELSRRQSGYGRGPRMQIEKDRVMIISGLCKGLTIGSPIGLLIKNNDFSINTLPSINNPRPGHADLSGILKYGFDNARCVLERASARETASRVAIGAVCKQFLAEFDIAIKSEVLSIGGKNTKDTMRKKIDEAIRKKDSLGGIFQIVASGMPVGLGSYAHADRRLDAHLAMALMSIPGIKAVEFGLGFAYADKFGSKVHDPIYFSKNKGYYRKTNNAGGIEGGMSNGEPIIIKCCMKPIATLAKPLNSVDINTKRATLASIQRADTVAIEAAGVVAEAVVAFEIASCLLEKFGGDCIKDTRQAFSAYLKRINK